MDRATFIQALATQGAEVENLQWGARCTFPCQDNNSLFFSVRVYEDGECALATHLKTDEEADLAYRQFELVDFSGPEELFKSVLEMVESILQLGLRVESKTGILFQRFTGTLGNGAIAFSNSYFRFGGFALRKRNGAVGTIGAKNA